MRFESGMLGFLVIVLAIGAAIAGTILLSAEEQTYEVTKYELVTDVTGLFDTDESPQYMDYDLSKNYTGYYTEETVSNGINYWGGATFTSTSVNNYPVKYKPSVVSTTETINLNDVNNLVVTNPPGEKKLELTYSAIPENYYNSIYQVKSVTLSSLLAELNLEGYDYVYLSSVSTNYGDNIYFTTKDQYNTSNSTVDQAIYVQNQPSTPPYYNLACRSCKVNLITNTVDYYSIPDGTQSSFVRSVSLSDAALIFKTSESYYVINPEREVLGDSLKVTKEVNAVVEYMDTSRGVTVTGVTA